MWYAITLSLNFKYQDDHGKSLHAYLWDIWGIILLYTIQFNVNM